MRQPKKQSTVVRPPLVEDLIYHMQSWNVVKTKLYGDYAQVYRAIENIFINFDEEMSYSVPTTPVKNQIISILEQYYTAVLDTSIKLLNDDYKKRHLEVELSLLGEHTAVEKTVLAAADQSGWVKVSLPVSTRYDTLFSIPKNIEVLMMGPCVLLIEGDRTDSTAELVADGDGLENSVVLDHKEKVSVTDFIPHQMDCLHKSIYKIEPGAKIFFPKQSLEKVKQDDIASVLVCFKPLIMFEGDPNTTINN